MPEEFMIAFWVLPTDLNSKSYLINAFDRAQIWAEQSTTRLQYKHITGPGENDYVKALDPTPTSNQLLQLSNWNYVAVSQRQVKTLTSLFYDI
jgi:hypothetical protein